MGRKKGRNSGESGSFSKQGGTLLNQLRSYQHVSVGVNVSALRPAYYEKRNFPTLDAIINARTDDDRVESQLGLSALNLSRPIVVKRDTRGALNRTDEDEEEEEGDENISLLSRREYEEASASSRSLCLDSLKDEMHRQISDGRDGHGQQQGHQGRVKIPSLSCLCIDRLAKDLDDWSDEADAAALGALLRENLRPEFSTLLSITALQTGNLNASTLPVVYNPMSRVLALGNSGKASDGGHLSIASVAAFLQSLRESAAELNSNANAPDDWEVLAIPSHLSGIELDVGAVEKGPTELFLCDVMFLTIDCITAFQALKGLKILHLYSFSTSPTSVRAYWERKARPCIYRESCVTSFCELFLTTSSFNELEHLSIDHSAGFRITLSGLASIGHAIAETRSHKHACNGLKKLRSLRVANLFGESTQSISLCVSFKAIGIDLCVL
jgi:hypothetical protein